MSQHNHIPTARHPRSRHLSGILETTGPDSRNSRARRWIHSGDLALAWRDPEVAQRAYAEALSLLVDADRELVADVHARRGHALALLGDHEAEACYEAALEKSPRHLPARRGLVCLLAKEEAWALVAEQEEKLFDSIEDPAHRCIELVASGDRWLTAAGARSRARIRYKRALHANPASAAARRRCGEETG